MYKVVLIKPECIGCGNCEGECPELFEVQEDGYSHIRVLSSTSDTHLRHRRSGAF